MSLLSIDEAWVVYFTYPFWQSDRVNVVHFPKFHKRSGERTIQRYGRQCQGEFDTLHFHSFRCLKKKL